MPVVAIPSLVVAIPSQTRKALLMCPYVSSGKFSVLAPRCSRVPLHNLQPTSDRCLIFASRVATRMILAIAIISRILCFQGTHGSFKYFPENALLAFCRNMKSAVHVPYAGWRNLRKLEVHLTPVPNLQLAGPDRCPDPHTDEHLSDTSITAQRIAYRKIMGAKNGHTSEIYTRYTVVS